MTSRMARYKCKPQNLLPKTFINNLPTTYHFELLTSLILSGINADNQVKRNNDILFFVCS